MNGVTNQINSIRKNRAAIKKEYTIDGLKKALDEYYRAFDKVESILKENESFMADSDLPMSLSDDNSDFNDIEMAMDNDLSAVRSLMDDLSNAYNSIQTAYGTLSTILNGMSDDDLEEYRYDMENSGSFRRSVNKSSDDDWMIYGRDRGTNQRFKPFDGEGGLTTNIIYAVRFPPEDGERVQRIVDEMNERNPSFEFIARRGRSSLFSGSDDDYEASVNKSKSR